MGLRNNGIQECIEREKVFVVKSWKELGKLKM